MRLSEFMLNLLHYLGGKEKFYLKAVFKHKLVLYESKVYIQIGVQNMQNMDNTIKQTSTSIL